MKNAWMSVMVCGTALSAMACIAAAQAPVADGNGAAELRVDNLKNPLGIDDPAPQFSWQLHDPKPGAKQTAYEVQVASSPELLARAQHEADKDSDD